ncbi:MAG TPA: phage tail protein [Acidimicrobiales bacterium]
MTDRGHTDPSAQYVDRIAGYDSRLQMLERSHHHEPQTPVGAMVDWPGPTVPNLWHPADGSSLATADYPDLFAVLGYTYGGTGANFNLPYARDRVTVGVNIRALAATGGQATVALSAAQTGTHTHALGANTGNETSYHTHPLTTGGVSTESVVHNHPFSATSGNPSGPHTHGVGFVAVVDAAAGSGAYGTGGGTTTTTGDSPNHTHAVSGTTGNESAPHAHTLTGATGTDAADHHHAVSGTTDAGGTTGAAHENMPPWLALTKIIKILPSTAAATTLTIVERNR